MHERRRMLNDTLQNVHEVVVRIDIVQPAGHQQALHNADMFGVQLGQLNSQFFLPIGMTRSAHSDLVATGGVPR